MKEKIIIFTTGYFPAEKYGGPPVSIKNMCATLRDKFDFYVICRNTDLDGSVLDVETDKFIHMNNSGEQVLYLESKDWNYVNFLKIIKEVDPALIYLQSFFAAKTVIPVLRCVNKTNKKLLIAPRGELLPGAIKNKWLKKIIYIKIMKRFFKSNNIYFQATSEEEISAVSQHLNNKYFYLNNFPTMKNSTEEMKPKKEKGKLRLVFISRITPKKNLDFALEVINEISSGEVIFDIYGPKEDEEYWEKCRQKFNNNKKVFINYKGNLSHQQVMSTFFEYDFFFFPTWSENFGHVITEAMASDCPVIISDNTPWNEINDYHSGFSLSLDNKNKFIKTIENLLNLTDDEYKKILVNNRKFLKEKLKVEELKKTYEKVFEDIICY
ncbi:glycosyltransferase [Tetragenococcus halophilus]|uniref:glycosyltransferase n=1 Tax=Tetragenococcus halophilus TaxID=51669 RepID=UPI0015C06E8F|nr:glycosyltransferase [Tetragenococcus halophilus]